MAESSSQSDEKLDLKVSDSHGALTHFKVKKTTKFRKILTAYASKAGIEERAIRLMVDGERVNLEQCPGDLDMENGDQIDAMVEQQGGLGQDPAAAAVAAALRANLEHTKLVEKHSQGCPSTRRPASLRSHLSTKQQTASRGSAPAALILWLLSSSTGERH